ncbi:MAG TPA: GxxExxY protein [Blastocatellia bacterium]|jgi:GxxExxY protein|nr:GxxExxY protein [Blastocatellia bacterium]
MNTDNHGFQHGEITQKIIGVFYEVYNELGHGFLESVYEKSLEVALNSMNLKVCRQIEIPVRFRGHKVGDFSADMLVEDCVLLELKAARSLDSSHTAQLLNYLRATDIEVGLLLNFGLKPEFKRLLFDNPRKTIRENPCLSVADLLIPDGQDT